MEHHIRYDQQQQALILLDQRLLPTVEEYYCCRMTEEVIYALREMVVRGAPAIGVTAAWGSCLRPGKCRHVPSPAVGSRPWTHCWTR